MNNSVGHIYSQLVFIFIGTFYVLLLITINSTLVDVTLSLRPDLGIEKLERIARVASSIAFGFPTAVFVTKLFFRENIFSSLYWKTFCVVFFLSAAVFTNLQRQVADYYVERTTDKERQLAIAGAAAMHALATGAITFPSIGMNSIDPNDPASKVMGGVLIPYMALSGKAKQLLGSTEDLMQHAAIKNNERTKSEIIRELESLCSESKELHADYIRHSESLTSGAFLDLKKKRYEEYRNEKLGYRGTLPLGLPYKQFISHPDIQYTLRAKLADAVSDSQYSAQLEFIYPINEQKTRLVTLFDRKNIDPCMDWDEYLLEYGGPIGSYFGKELSDIIESGELNNSQRKNEFDEIGKKAVYALITPPLGMVWTLISATVAVVILISRVFSIVFSRFHGLIIAIVILILIISLPYKTSNRFVDSPQILQGFDYVKEQYGVTGRPLAATFEWGIRSTPIVYPIGYKLRLSILGRVFRLNTI